MNDIKTNIIISAAYWRMLHAQAGQADPDRYAGVLRGCVIAPDPQVEGEHIAVATDGHALLTVPATVTGEPLRGDIYIPFTWDRPSTDAARSLEGHVAITLEFGSSDATICYVRASNGKQARKPFTLEYLSAATAGYPDWAKVLFGKDVLQLWGPDGGKARLKFRPRQFAPSFNPLLLNEVLLAYQGRADTVAGKVRAGFLRLGLRFFASGAETPITCMPMSGEWRLADQGRFRLILMPTR